ncbi:helix-turn-helix domain-containing protein [Paenibacillus sp. S-38]|uniref:helix-turn-helix domain-containing protein n=1 Tax=Paenibacillus sp. S-38 TaxID=3416710 RepID=UPI003CEDCFF5
MRGAKSRSTTWDERIDIVHYRLANLHDYHKTAGQFQASYQKVYQWVKKFEAGGPDALKDGRGQKKTPEELAEADHQKLEMKKMDYEKERLRAENAFLNIYGILITFSRSFSCSRELGFVGMWA